jgi:hypothetical protein
MAPVVKAMAQIPAKIPCAILVTKSSAGFITSDSPCVHFDPEAWKRPRMMLSGMMWPSLEVTFPLTPRHMLFFNRQLTADGAYTDIPEDFVDALNARTRWHCDEQFIVRSNLVREAWFDTGTPPDGPKADAPEPSAPTG